jgi:hypothetical protein
MSDRGEKMKVDIYNDLDACEAQSVMKTEANEMLGREDALGSDFAKPKCQAKYVIRNRQF